jgi:nucleotide-binding universal stress UspA family protein
MSTSENSAPTDRPFVVVVALDLADTPSGGFALDQAARIALRVPGSQMHALHVSSGEAKQETLGLLQHYVSEKLSLLAGATKQSIAVHVREGEPGAEIALLAAELSADMIVVGTHKAAHLKNLFIGSTAERVMAHATCPVFVAGPKPKPQPSHVIVIEAACPDCVRARLDTSGRAWWCERHSEPHAVLRHPHFYSYDGLQLAQHDSAITPTGVDVD